MAASKPNGFVFVPCAHLERPLLGLLGEVLVDDLPAGHVREQVAEGGAGGRAEADQHQCRPEREQEARQDRQENRARNRERLQTAAPR